MKFKINKKFISIRNKFILGFLIIFIAAFMIFYYFITNTIENNNEVLILNEIKLIKKNADIYINQYFLINNDVDVDEEFSQNGNIIVSNLSKEINNEVILYSKCGEKIHDSNLFDEAIYGNDNDLKLAIQNKVAYTINYSDKKVWTNFSFPIIIDGKNHGILRFVRDYSEIYERGRIFIRYIVSFTILLFFSVFIFSVILSNRITLPIIHISEAAKCVSNGEFDVNIDENSKDEIGVLASNFNKMVNKIKHQIEVIEKDKEDIEKLSKHRKEFFDNAAHELKTPLTTILGYSQVLEEYGCKNQEVFCKGINHIKNESKRLHKLVIDILEISKFNSDKNFYNMKRMNISNILYEACSEMGLKAKKYNIIIKKDIQENLFINGDCDRIKEIFINIIDNSIKYGYVNSQIYVHAYKDENNVYIINCDRGKGIEKKKLQKIFEPFYRADKKNSRELGSSGLGLSISKSIVEKHNGNILINSIEGQGTRVQIVFPYYN